MDQSERRLLSSPIKIPWVQRLSWDTHQFEGTCPLTPSHLRLPKNEKADYGDPLALIGREDKWIKSEGRHGTNDIDWDYRLKLTHTYMQVCKLSTQPSCKWVIEALTQWDLSCFHCLLSTFEWLDFLRSAVFATLTSWKKLDMLRGLFSPNGIDTLLFRRPEKGPNWNIAH